MDDLVDRLNGLAGQVLDTFKGLRGVLAALPTPLLVAGFDLSGDNRRDVFADLDRARHLILGEPVPEDVIVTLDMLILDWFSAFELLAVATQAGPTPWRLDAITYALERCTLGFEEIEDMTKGNADTDEES